LEPRLAPEILDQNVLMRRQPLSAQEVAEAIRLYKDGWSLARIGMRLGS
jgi:hypothetical protein